VGRVKRHGGLVLVQDAATARAAGMPAYAIGTGCVDFALPLELIAPGPGCWPWRRAVPSCSRCLSRLGPAPRLITA
jgi:hypothetical protein